jgi:hypothetical protein
VLAQQLAQLEVRDRLAGNGRVERVARGIGSVAPDRRLDPAAPGPGPSANERQVLAVDCAPADQPLQTPVRLLRPSHDEQPGRVAVEPVNDPGPLGLLAARRGMGEQPVDQGPDRVSGRRVDDEAGGLVDDEQMLVLPRDPQLHLLGDEIARHGLGRVQLDLLAADEPKALRAHLAVDVHPASGEQALGGRAGADLRQLGEEAVESLPGGCVRNGAAALQLRRVATGAARGRRRRGSRAARARRRR